MAWPTELDANVVLQCQDITNAYEVIKGKAKSFTVNVPLPSIEGFKLNGTYSDVVIASTSNTV